jgi:adenosylmethionine-8-amino-7-oxononanoate aminotransferase
MADYMAGTPTVIVAGDGCELIDADGRRYIDAVSSLWCNVHGHRDPELDAALKAQIDRIAHSTFLGLTNPPAIELGRLLCEAAPPGLTRVFFSDSGATAVEVALKMAYQYQHQRPDPKPGKIRFMALKAAYHGDTLGDVSIGDIGRFHAIFGPLLFPTLRAEQPNCYRCPYGLRRETCGVFCGDEAVRLLERHADELAAVVIEPGFQGAGGIVPIPEGYLRKLADAAKANDVLLIADEVAAGFGRTGSLFACQREGVTPDFLCLAKGITGGYLPLAATLTREAIFEAFLDRPEEDRTFFHGHTYTGNPLACSVAVASLKKMLRPGGVMEKLPGKVELFAELLAPLRRTRSSATCGRSARRRRRTRGRLRGEDAVRRFAAGRQARLRGDGAARRLVPARWAKSSC